MMSLRRHIVPMLITAESSRGAQTDQKHCSIIFLGYRQLLYQYFKTLKLYNFKDEILLEKLYSKIIFLCNNERISTWRIINMNDVTIVPKLQIYYLPRRNDSMIEHNWVGRHRNRKRHFLFDHCTFGKG